MCGRVTTKIERKDFMTLFGLPLPDDFGASEEVFPTQQLPLLRLDALGRREVVMTRWGLVPSWHKGEWRAWRANTINARCEDALAKPAFREPLRKRRALAVVSSFFEWRDGIRYEIRRRDGKPLVLAAVWDRWQRGGERVESCAVFTCPASGELSVVHGRMPCVLLSRDWEQWLNPLAEVRDVHALLTPLQNGLLRVEPGEGTPTPLLAHTS